MDNRLKIKVHEEKQKRELPRQNKHRFSSLVVMLLLFAVTPVHALDFGSVAKNDVVHIKSGDIAKFSLLFWSRDVAEQSVQLSAEAPEGWTVLVNPASFKLSRSAGSEYVSIGRESIRAVPVIVTAIPSTFGTSYIKLRAVAGIPSGDISFFQERVITLTVDVESQVDIALGDIEIGETAAGEESGSDRTAAAGRTTIGGGAAEAAGEEGGDDMLLYFVLAVVIIIIISVIIYRSGQRRSELEELKQLIPGR